MRVKNRRERERWSAASQPLVHAVESAGHLSRSQRRGLLRLLRTTKAIQPARTNDEE